MTQPPERPAVDPSRFASFAAMRTAHTSLLRVYRDQGTSPDLLTEAEDFVRAGSRTGSLIQGDDDRLGAQSLLDYWAAILSRAERVLTEAVLEEFDSALVPELADSLCPYIGLEAFGEARRQMFFGRERVLNEMVAHLQKQRFLAVVGGLGSGKSSIVLGALIPALKNGVITGSRQWRYYPPFVPGADPMASLARAVGADSIDAGLATAADVFNHVERAADTVAVVVVDRFEEVFSVCPTSDKRDAFADALVKLSQSPRRHVVIVTMRTDFEAQIAAIPQLLEVFDRANLRLPPLSATELRDAIIEPAEQVGLKFEEGLVDRLVKEILGEPAGLPLLQFTLLKLWDLRERNLVTLEAYRQIGGGRQALARAADQLYDELPPADQKTLKTILLLMARPSAGNEVISSVVRRSAFYAKADGASVDRVERKLLESRLVRLVPGEEGGNQRFEIAHDALLSNWPRLVDWLDEERLSTRRRVRLTSAAEQWRAHGRDLAALLRGSLLDEAKTYDDLSPFEVEFIATSDAARAREVAEGERLHWRELEHATTLAAEQKQRADEQTLAAAALRSKNRLLISLTTLVAVLFIVAVTGWLFAERRRSEAVLKQQTVEALMSGQGVVVEESEPRPATAADPATVAPPAPTPIPVPITPAGAEPTPAERPNPALLGRAPLAAPPVPGAARDAAAIVSQVRLRASRRPTGRQISGTELPAYEFTAWAEGPAEAMAQIDSIVYEFNHPTFRQKEQTGRNRASGFRVGYTGWGCLSTVVVTFHVRGSGETPPHVDFDMCNAIDEGDVRSGAGIDPGR